VSSESVPGGSKRTVVIVLGVVAVLCVILGILYFAGATPSFLNSGSHVHKGGHNFRGIAALVVGIVAGAGAWWQSKKA
jgi:hypothetical protein